MNEIKFSVLGKEDEDITELFEELKEHFEYSYFIDSETMGSEKYQFILGKIKAGVKILSEIITTWLKGNRTVIELKSGDKSLSFDGSTHMWSNDEIVQLIDQFFEG